jgi:hypothetical protein
LGKGKVQAAAELVADEKRSLWVRSTFVVREPLLGNSL